MATPRSIMALFTSFVSGIRMVDGGELQQLANLAYSAKAGIVAKAGGGQALATQLTAANNSVDTCATNSDSVMLPLAIPGAFCKVWNNTGQTLAIFGQPSNPYNANSAGDTIANSTSNTQQATATGITLATAKVAEFTCYTTGQWKQLISG